MTLNYKAKISLDAKDKTRAIFESVNADNDSFAENPVKTRMVLDDTMAVYAESEHLPNLRANLNSTLRLIQSSYESIESVKI